MRLEVEGRGITRTRCTPSNKMRATALVMRARGSRVTGGAAWQLSVASLWLRQASRARV